MIPSFNSMTFCTTQLLSAQQAEHTNLNIYTSYKPIIIPAINLLATDPSLMEVPTTIDESNEACYPS